jgi:hypothetical protein
VKRGALVWSFIVALALLAFAGHARADDDEVCGPRTRGWAAACTAAGAGRVEAFQCPPGHIVFSVTMDRRAPVFVDATSEPSGLRQIGGVGLSPIGEFDDFRTAPQPVRDGFERVAACVERDSALPLGEPARIVARPDHKGSSAPWRLVAGVVLAAVALASRRRFPLRTAALLLALGAATFALAYGLVGTSFFHQNGHGPNWIGYALGEPCTYGPGFEELFGWAARHRPEHPESLVFGCNGVLAATCPIAAWVVARRVGAPTSLAWGIAVALAIDPLLLRIAFTESYYVQYSALLLLGTAVALSAPTLRPWSPRFLLASAAAGLMLSEAARVHPVGWVAVAAVPLAHLARPGAARRRLRQAAIATATIGAVIAGAAGLAIFEVLAGATGAQYLPELRRGSHQELKQGLALLLAVGIAVAITRTWRGRWPLRAALILVVFAAATAGTSLLNVDVDWVRAAHARMFQATAVAAFVGVVSPVLRRWRYPRAVLALVLALGLANAAAHRHWVTELPTDALELRLALSWREDMASGSRLVTVETAGIAAVQLPFYSPHRDQRAPVVRLDAQGAPPALGSFGDRVYYYRSSLCSTALGRSWCDALERTATLEPIDVHELPARPSTHVCVYDSPTVRVGLYRVMGTNSAPPYNRE